MALVLSKMYIKIWSKNIVGSKKKYKSKRKRLNKLKVNSNSALTLFFISLISPTMRIESMKFNKNKCKIKIKPN